MESKKDFIEILFNETYFNEDCDLTEAEAKEMKAMDLEEKEECLIEYYRAAGFSINSIEDIMN